MISFETSITLTVSLLVGFISIAVTIYGKNTQEKDVNKQKNKKIVLYISIVFLICLVAVWSLYFIADSSTIAVIQQYIVRFSRFFTDIINVITPAKGKLFQAERFAYGYFTGYAILTLPTLLIVMLDFFSHEKKRAVSKVLGLICKLFCAITFLAWLEYYLSFSTYSTFIEFSSDHFIIANTILNFIILAVFIAIMIKLESISS